MDAHDHLIEDNAVKVLKARVACEAAEEDPLCHEGDLCAKASRGVESDLIGDLHMHQTEAAEAWLPSFPSQRLCSARPLLWPALPPLTTTQSP